MRTLCAWCGKILKVALRNPPSVWDQMWPYCQFADESEYVESQRGKTSHGVCDECRDKNFGTPLAPVQMITVQNNLPLPLVVRAVRVLGGAILITVNDSRQRVTGRAIEVPAYEPDARMEVAEL